MKALIFPNSSPITLIWLDNERFISYIDAIYQIFRSERVNKTATLIAPVPGNEPWGEV